MNFCHAVVSTLILLPVLAPGCGRMSPPTPVAKTLHEAALFYPDQIPKLIAKGASVNQLDRDGNSALFVAATFSKPESVWLLLAAGADTSVRGQRGWTPLHCTAFRHRCGPADIQVARLLLENGADPNAIAGEYGETPLHFAVAVAQSPTLVQLLIDAGANVDAQSDSDKDTPLQRAVAQRNYAITELLLEAGASPRIENNAGFIPQQQAPEDTKIAALFEKYADQ